MMPFPCVSGSSRMLMVSLALVLMMLFRLVRLVGLIITVQVLLLNSGDAARVTDLLS